MTTDIFILNTVNPIWRIENNFCSIAHSTPYFIVNKLRKKNEKQYYSQIGSMNNKTNNIFLFNFKIDLEKVYLNYFLL